MNLTQNKTKNIKSFLPYRIFFSVFFLITLPLFIYAVVLYVAEYSQKKDEVFNANSFIANQIKLNIEEDFIIKQQILNLTADEVSLKKGDINNFFKSIAKQFNLLSLFYAEYENNNLVIKNAADKETIGKKVNVIEKIIKNRVAFFKSKSLNCSNCIYFSKSIFDNNNIVGVIVLSVLQKDFLEFSQKDLPINLEISIINPKDQVIVSTNAKYKYLDSIDNKNKLITKDSIYDNAYFLITAVDSKNIQLLHLKNYFLKHGIILGITFFVLFIAAWLLIKVLAKPIDELMHAMHSVKNGDVDARYTKHKMGFEINYLGDIFNKMMDSLLYHQNEIQKAKIDKLQYLRDMKIAQDIQLSLLPDKELNIKNMDLAFGNIYAKEVGGDFYDFIEKDGKVFFIIADIASKGIEACLYALTLRSIVRSFATTVGDLEQIILSSNKLFLEDAVKNNMFATAFFGVLNIPEKKMQYCNCGHMPAILRKEDKKIEFLKTRGKALGIEKLDNVEINEVILQDKDLIFLYTDGVIDAIDVNNKFYGENNLLEFIKNTNGLKAQEVVTNLFEKLKNYSKNSLQYDDATVVVFRII
ncbi:MAG: sigma regulatory family protein-PP2C phosphatase [uncultured bacterium]|nr:MAG: sigma regulatory family protein-PP2C phosphatase [uncultured bacterium]